MLVSRASRSLRACSRSVSVDATPALSRRNPAARCALLVGAFGGVGAASYSSSVADTLHATHEMRHYEKIFERADADRDDRLSKQELREYLRRRGFTVRGKDFDAMWAVVDAESDDPDSLGRAEFIRFMQHAQRNYLGRVCDSMSNDPAAIGSAMYLGGSVLFAALPALSPILPLSSAALMRCGQTLYIAGGFLFMSIQVEKHAGKIDMELALRSDLE